MKKNPTLIYNILLIGAVLMILYSLSMLYTARRVEDAILIGLVGIALVVIFYKMREKAVHSFCPGCGYHYNFEDDIAYESVGSRVTPGKYGQAIVTVQFTCYCRDCRKVNTFRRDFTSAVSRGDWVEEKNVERDIRKHFI